MKKGINYNIFPKSWSFQECLIAASQSGYSGIELMVEENEGVLNLQSSISDVREIAKQCKELALEVPTLSTTLHNKYSLSNDNFDIRSQGIDIALKMIEFASIFESDIIQIVPGVVDSSDFYDHAYNTSLTSLTQLSKVAEDSKITIGLENVSNNFIPSPLEFCNLINEINSDSVQLYLNLGNALATGFPEHWIKLMKDRIVCIHAKDFNINSNIFVPVLTGDVNWQYVMKLLREANYEGYILSALPQRYHHNWGDVVELTSQNLDSVLHL